MSEIPSPTPIHRRPPRPGAVPSAWGRVFGEQIDNHYGAFADPRASGSIVGLQVGLDLWRGSVIPDQRDRAGVYFAHSNENAGVNGLVTNLAANAYVLQHTGSLNLEGWTIGGYWTHYGQPAGISTPSSRERSMTGATSTSFSHLSTDGSGGQRLEGGYPFPLRSSGPGFVFEPQARIIGQWVGFDPNYDGATQVALGSGFRRDGVRVGVRTAWRVENELARFRAYLRANLWNDWSGNAVTTYAHVTPVPLLEHGQWLELDGGLTTKVNAKLSFYINGNYQFAVGDTPGGARNGVGGTLGLEYKW